MQGSRWERGEGESGGVVVDGTENPLSICALGGSVATPPEGITAELVEVKSLAEAERLGERGRGKIVFFNRPMDPAKGPYRRSVWRRRGSAHGRRFGGC